MAFIGTLHGYILKKKVYFYQNYSGLKNDQFVLRSWHIYVALLMGTIVRLAYGIYAQNWMSAPDQIAWQLSIDEAVANGAISYRSLIHYPHEGGSIFISLIAICLKPFENLMPPLSLAALLIELFGRYIQIKFTQRLFGSKVAGWFAVWTILSIPLVLPWATLNFGLHSLLSFLPFVFLSYLTQDQSKNSKFLLCGIITGLSLSLSYNSVIFIPAFIVYTFFTLTDIKKSLICISKYLVFTFLTLIPHLAARYFLDSGFNLQDDPVFSIRGLTAEGTMSGEQLSNFIVSWHRVLPASFLLSSISFISTYLQRDLVFVFFMITVVLISVRFRNNNTAIYSALLLVFLYLLFYALSPFYADEIDMKSYVYYRHITYIAPLIAMIMVCAFGRFKSLNLYLLIPFLLICGTGSIMLITETETRTNTTYDAAGWVLAQKYGDDVEKLMSIHAIAPENEKKELMSGYGWGLTAVILNDKSGNDSMSVNQLLLILNKFPSVQQELLYEGVNHAFNKNITPQLDPQLLILLEKKWEIK